MKPHRPRPPYKPEAPEVDPEMPEVVPEIPEVVIPEIPEVVVPEIPDEETLGALPEARLRDPEDPYGLKRLNREMKQRLQEMGKGGVKGPNPNKPSPWMDLQTRLNRKQRSVQISTVVNAEDFDPLNTFDVELEDNWQCDMCEYVTGVLRSYLEKNMDTIEGEVATLGNKFCDRLPFTTVNECKAEVADVVPTFVSTLLDQLTSSNLCGAALQVC